MFSMVEVSHEAPEPDTTPATDAAEATDTAEEALEHNAEAATNAAGATDTAEGNVDEASSKVATNDPFNVHGGGDEDNEDDDDNKATQTVNTEPAKAANERGAAEKINDIGGWGSVEPVKDDGGGSSTEPANMSRLQNPNILGDICTDQNRVHLLAVGWQSGSL